MTRELTTENVPAEDSDTEPEFLQFRGRGTSVTIDGVPVRFTVAKRNGRLVHEPHPIVEPDAQDPPEDAVVRPLAEHLVETNNLIAFGVACEAPDCEEVFATPEELNGHMQTHTEPGDDAGTTDTETEE